MKKAFLKVLFVLIITNIILAQETKRVIPKYKSVQLSIGMGIKYHRYIPYKKDNYWPKGAEKYLPNYAFDIGVAKDFWGTGKHFIGLELLGYPDTYGESAVKPKDFSLILNIFYKRNIILSKKIGFEHDIGFGIFSNDLASFLNIFTNLKIKYVFPNFIFFIKNNFRWGFLLFGKNIPWVISAGISIKI